MRMGNACAMSRKQTNLCHGNPLDGKSLLLLTMDGKLNWLSPFFFRRKKGLDSHNTYVVMCAWLFVEPAAEECDCDVDPMLCEDGWLKSVSIHTVYLAPMLTNVPLLYIEHMPCCVFFFALQNFTHIFEKSIHSIYILVNPSEYTCIINIIHILSHYI